MGPAEPEVQPRQNEPGYKNQTGQQNDGPLLRLLFPAVQPLPQQLRRPAVQHRSHYRHGNEQQRKKPPRAGKMPGARRPKQQRLHQEQSRQKFCKRTHQKFHKTAFLPADAPQTRYMRITSSAHAGPAHVSAPTPGLCMSRWPGQHRASRRSPFLVTVQSTSCFSGPLHQAFLLGTTVGTRQGREPSKRICPIILL